MKKRATAILVVLMVVYALFSGVTMAADMQQGEVENKAAAPAVNPNPDAQTAQDPLEEGAILLKQRKFDEAARVLEKAAAADPYNFETNVLLAKALLGKCARLKQEGNTIYQTLVHRPYRIGQRLYRVNPTRPEPYYLVAKSLLINNRPQKAVKVMRKGIYYAGPGHPEYAEYNVVLGDAYTEMLGGFGGDYVKAKEAYQAAMAEKQDDPEFKARIEARMKILEEKRDTSTGRGY